MARAKKKSRTEASTSSQGEPLAQSWQDYLPDYDHRPLVDERPLKHEEPLQAYVDRRRWKVFAGSSRLAPADRGLVKEVYARLQFDQLSEMEIDGCTVNFSPEAINAHFGLRRPPIDQFRTMQPSERDICLELTGAEPRTDGRKHIPKADLTPKARLINLFVNSRIMPTTLNSEIRERRARLIYAISRDLAVDIGQVIREEMEAGTRPVRANASLGFPNLITAMCIRAGIRPRGDPSSFIPVGSEIRFETIRHRDPPPLRQEPPPPSPPTQSPTLPPPSPPPSPPQQQQQEPEQSEPEPETARATQYGQIREDIQMIREDVDILRTHVDHGFLQIRSEIQSLRELILSRFPAPQPPPQQ
ncbi:hypothetical protein [Candidatus Burkholderia verschuerenii]|uniref:hypothetical protein n=1 Tax=Candidatus Burkholderia verschuerenii TaxID=242163 RepID=UPI000A84140C